MNTKEYETKELLSRFAPYYKPHMGTLCMDLFCAALTTICELVLPLIMRYITNEGIRDLAALSVKTILMLGALYLVLRIIDGIANYYMAYTGHVMGAKIETGMRICRSCLIRIITIRKSVRLWGGLPTIYLMLPNLRITVRRNSLLRRLKVWQALQFLQ